MGEKEKAAGVEGGSLTAFATLPPIATPSTPARRPRSGGGDDDGDGDGGGDPDTAAALAATMHVVATASDRGGDGSTPQAVSQVLADLDTSHNCSLGLLQQLTKEVARVHQQVEQETQAAIQQAKAALTKHYETTAAALQQDNEQLQQRLRSQEQALAAQLGECNTLRQEVTELQLQLGEEQHARSLVEKELAEQEAGFDVSQQQLEKAFTETLADAQATRDKDAAQIKTQKETIKKLKGQVSALQSQLDDLQANSDKVSSSREEEQRKLSAAHRRQKDELTKAKAELQKTKDELQSLQKANSSLELASKQTQRQHDEALRKQVEQNKAKLMTLRQENDTAAAAAAQEIGQLKSKIGQLQAKLTQALAAPPPPSGGSYDLDDARMQILIKQNRAEKKRLEASKRK